MARKKKIDLQTLKDTPPWDWPEGTGKMLLDLLRDEGTPERDRLIALELAGDSTVIDDKLAEALLSHVADGKRSDAMRALAAVSLGPALEHADTMGFDDPEDVAISERMFEKIKTALQKQFSDASLSVELRRRLLEAAVRAPMDWHEGAIRAAYAEKADPWRLTAVFCMRYVRGFDAEILEAIQDRSPEIRCEAILAAGAWALDAAWPTVSALISDKGTEKPLLMAAIDAVSTIRPKETPQLLEHLVDSEDEDIADAVAEALDNAEVAELEDGEDLFGEDDDDLDDDDEDDDDDDEDDDDEGEEGPERKVLN